MPHSNELNLKDFMRQHKSKTPILSQSVDYVNPKEYAQIIKAHPVTIYGLLNAGRIEGAVKIGQRWRIPMVK